MASQHWYHATKVHTPYPHCADAKPMPRGWGLGGGSGLVGRGGAGGKPRGGGKHGGEGCRQLVARSSFVLVGRVAPATRRPQAIRLNSTRLHSAPRGCAFAEQPTESSRCAMLQLCVAAEWSNGEQCKASLRSSSETVELACGRGEARGHPADCRRFLDKPTTRIIPADASAQ